jgi:biopolymer transport protein ExbD
MSKEPKRRAPDKIPVDMTPMIDIVFQLLTFFCMTLKIAAAEGDFQIKMPLTGLAPGTVYPKDLPPIRVYLKANESSDCTHIVMNEREFSGPDRWNRLHRQLAEIVGEGNLAQEAEVELHCDPQLHYEHAVAAITAVSGRIDPATGQIVKLIEKIHFAPPRMAAN